MSDCLLMFQSRKINIERTISYVLKKKNVLFHFDADKITSNIYLIYLNE